MADKGERDRVRKYEREEEVDDEEDADEEAAKKTGGNGRTHTFLEFSIVPQPTG